MGLLCGNGGCLWLPSPLRAVEGALESVDPVTSRTASSRDNNNTGSIHVEDDNAIDVAAMPKRRGLTIILTLEEFSNVAQTTRWIQKHKKEIKNVLLGTPPTQKSSRRSRRSHTQQPQPQPNWSSPGIATLFDALAVLPNLERLLLYDIGTTDNPLPLATTLVKMLSHPRPCLDQVYIVGALAGNYQDCVKLGQGITLQPKLTQFAWYGSGIAGGNSDAADFKSNEGFTADPILKAVASVPTITELHVQLQGSSHPVNVNTQPSSVLSTASKTSFTLSPQTMQAVGNMAQLTSLTLHNCDTNGNSKYGNHLAILAKALEKSTSLISLTVFEAFEGLYDPATYSMASQKSRRDSVMLENEDDTNPCRNNHDYQHKNHEASPLPQATKDSIGSSSSCEALYSLIRMSSSLEHVQIWFGFSRHSDDSSQNNGNSPANIMNKGSSNVLIPFAKALADNPHQKLKSFETALLWSDYDQDATAQAFVDVLSNTNTATNLKGRSSNANVSLQSLSLGSSNSKKTAHLNSDTYHGKWEWSLTFYLRLNQTGRQKIQERSESMTSQEWIEEVLTTSVIPESGVSSKQLALFRRQNHEEQLTINLLESSRPPCCPRRRRRHRCRHLTSDGELDDDDGDGADEDWFIISWIYYYLRQNPSMCYMYLDAAPAFQ